MGAIGATRVVYVAVQQCCFPSLPCDSANQQEFDWSSLFLMLDVVLLLAGYFLLLGLTHKQEGGKRENEQIKRGQPGCWRSQRDAKFMALRPKACDFTLTTNRCLRLDSGRTRGLAEMTSLKRYLIDSETEVFANEQASKFPRVTNHKVLRGCQPKHSRLDTVLSAFSSRC